jgi:hypothetical protein
MTDINVWAVLVAAIAGFPLGALWYSHRVFGRIWNRHAGRGPEAMEPHPARVFGLSFVFFLVTAAAFAYWLGPNPALETAVFKSLLAGCGLVAASFGVTYQFASLGLVMWLIDAGYHVLRFVIVGLILALWH